MKSGLIEWDKSVYDGTKRLLPKGTKFFTYLILEDKTSWSLVLEFEAPPILQGYISEAKVYFLVEDAPTELLKEGFSFDVFDGPNKVGRCEIVEEKGGDLSEILEKIEVIDKVKKDLQQVMGSIKLTLTSDLNLLKRIVSFSPDYPFVFPFILKHSPSIALEFLEKYCYRFKDGNGILNLSHLPFLFYSVINERGINEFENFFNSLPDELKKSAFINSAYQEAV